MENCVFCKIINNELPCYNIYEDDKVLVFLSINAFSNGHTLIIPKKHYLNFREIDLETLNHIIKIAKDIYNLLEQKLKPDSIKLVQNNGLCQEVKHFHLHLIPKYREEEKISIEEVYNKLINWKENR